MAAYCTTQDILDYDANSKNLTSTPNAPNFSIQIGFISDEIDMRLKQCYPGMGVDKLDNVDQLKLICINGVLALLWRSAVIARGSAAQFASEGYQKSFDNLMKLRLDLANGETVKPGVGRVYRS